MTIKCEDKNKCHKCKVYIECCGNNICSLPGFNKFELAKKKWCENIIEESKQIIGLAKKRLQEIEKYEKKKKKLKKRKDKKH